MAPKENGIFDEAQNVTTLRERLANYFSNWPLFLICLVISVSAGIIYIRYTIPKYIATTTFLIKGAEGSSSGNANDLIESALSGKREINLNNEILLLSASSMMERTVLRHGFNVSYFRQGRVKNIDINNDAPFTLTAKKLTDSSRTYTFNLRNIYMMGGKFSYGLEKQEKLYSFYWNVPFSVDGQVFVLSSKRIIQNEIDGYITKWQPVSAAAADLSRELVIKSYDTRTSVIQLSIKTENLQKGQEVLDALLAEFSLSDREDRIKLSTTTVQFIDERLVAISSELKGVEGNLENYQGRNQLIDIKGQSAQSMENSNVASKTIKDLAIQKGVTSMILEYFANPANTNKLVPSSLGLNDGTLALLITQYNELQLKKEREAPHVAQNSTVMQDLNTQIGNLKTSILESLNNITKNLSFQEGNFQQQNNQYKNFLASIPHNERVMQEIKRKQSITEGLYLYLLQKREETAISGTASNVAHYKQIDPATGYGPVEPNNRNIILYTALLGFFLAFAWVYIKDLLNDKITIKDDVVKKTGLPLMGQISHIPNKLKQVLSVFGRNIIAEEFRAVRAKLFFYLRSKNGKVILVTSSTSNEGKSFISFNLAAVCAIPGKKVALLEFDIRNPVIAKRLELGKSKGLTSFLEGDVKVLSDISFELKEIPTLHIYPSGSVSSNPADLLLSENLKRLFQILREKYDYVIIDSPPIGLVSDALILEQYAEIVLYIIRQRITLKNQLAIINDIIGKDHLHNIHLILNDVKTRQQYDYPYGNNYTVPENNVSFKKKESWLNP